MKLQNIKTLEKAYVKYNKELNKATPLLAEVDSKIDAFFAKKATFTKEEFHDLQNEQMYLRYTVDALGVIVEDIQKMIADIESIQSTIDHLDYLQKDIKKRKDEANLVLPKDRRIK